MKHLIYFLFLTLTFTTVYGQISGHVKNEKGENLKNVNVYLSNTFTGTTTNQEGNFLLKVNTDVEALELVVKYLGYETKRIKVNPENFPVKLNIVLKKKVENLDEVMIQPGENPAIAIIENAINNRKKNLARLQSYKADFYSKGLWEVKNVPEKILGQEVGDMGGILDSTRSGILYLSETFSKIAYRAPNDFKEKITASKISGDDNGFSFNSARSFDFTFYNNTTEIGADMVSPIANFALNYYDYKLEDVFYEKGIAINKIKVIPKRENDNAYSGYIYITDDTGEIYGADLNVDGKTLNVSFVKEVNIKFNYKYSETYNFWVNISKNINFSFKILGIEGSGYFVGNYNDYNFEPNFQKGFFNAETTSFTKDANKKDSIFWKTNRPVELTDKEENDYVVKDSIQKVKNSKTYKDSIDEKNNKFKWLDVLTGYSHQNSITKNYWGFKGLGLTGIHFNTVQGFNFSSGFYFENQDSIAPQSKNWRIDIDASYGRADERLRFNGSFRKKFNNFSRPVLQISGGVKLNQINRTNPISIAVADGAATFYEENFLKLYEKRYASVYYKEEILNGLKWQTQLTFQERKALTNSRNAHVFGYDDGGFTSNNPLAPDDFGSILFPKHTNFEVSGSFRYRFNQTYRTTPNGKFNYFDRENPQISLSYRTGLGASEDGFNYALFKSNITQEVGLSNKGSFIYSLNAGIFVNADDINFLDFQHFNGNETVVADGSRYMDQFHLLPYYARSTNQEFAHFHAEQNFEGYIMNKIPLLKALNSELVIGGKTLLTEGKQPYSELSIGLDNLGFGIARFFRVDYVRNFQSGGDDHGIMLGISILQ